MLIYVIKAVDIIGRRNKKLRLSNRKTVHGLSTKTFVTNSRKDERNAQRAALLMRGIITLVIAAGIIIFLTFVFGYLIPYLQSEFTTGVQSSESSASENDVVSIMQYDDLGLPIYDNEFSLYVINTKYTAPAEFEPETEKVNGVYVDSKIATNVKMMINAAKDDGLQLDFSQGYTSYSEQEQMYESKVNELMNNGESSVMARKNARNTVPLPGESDFQTGLCLKINGDPETFTTSKTYEWLVKNMADYGFTFRYPKGAETKTGINEDYTVIRYVGKENAISIRQLQMSLEEYKSYLNSQ